MYENKRNINSILPSKSDKSDSVLVNSSLLDPHILEWNLIFSSVFATEQQHFYF